MFVNHDSNSAFETNSKKLFDVTAAAKHTEITLVAWNMLQAENDCSDGLRVKGDCWLAGSTSEQVFWNKEEPVKWPLQSSLSSNATVLKKNVFKNPESNKKSPSEKTC